MNQFQESWGWQLLVSAIMIGGVATSGNCALGQVASDNTLGTTVTSTTPEGFQINGGATRGTNLFHSFQEFSVPTNGFAYFNNALTIQNIISRVTGVSVSNIDGIIAANGTANLFLINPNGIVFGAGASLNIGGSFLASTASSVVFDNGFEFSATNPQAPPLLSVNVPLGLQYGTNPGRIVSQSVFGLRVSEGKTLGLVGGDVVIEGGFHFAPNGRIELGSVAGNTQVNLTPTDTGYALNYDGIEDFQDIRLLRFASIASGTRTGSIQVQGRNVTLTDGSTIALLIEGAAVGASLTVNASESVQVISTSANGLSASGLFVFFESTGNEGNLNITTPRLLISEGAFVSASGGNLTINASESVQVIGRSANGQLGSNLSNLATRTGGTRNAANLTITSPVLLVRDGAQVSASTLGAGKGGNLIINASDSVQVIGTSVDGQISSKLSANTLGTGEAGNLTITTRRLLISNGAEVSASTFGTGKGGILTVNASEQVQVIGGSADDRFGSNLSVQANGKVTGDAGNLSITTPRLLIADGAFVSANTYGAGKGGILRVNASESVQVIGFSANRRFGSYLSANTDGAGDAGDLSITTPRLLIADGASVSASTYGAGKGGKLFINASESVQVIGRSADSQIPSFLSTQANSTATGEAGDLSITTPRLLISDGAFVSASTTGAGKGGILRVNASESVKVMGESADGRFPSALAVQAQGTGDAGNLTITTSQLLVRDGAYVGAGTFGSGKGGNLIVNASESVNVIGKSADGQFSSGLFASAANGGTAGDMSIETKQMSVRDGARVTVSSPSGQAGNLTIKANSLSLNRGTILAETAKSNPEGGANITLQNLDILRMDNESLISASALEDANGGNVTIDSTFIVATPPKGPKGSDITANAVRGNGGSVSLTTQGLFGIEFRPQLTPKNDITVSSQFGLTGVFEQDTPGVDPSRGLAELPTEVVDATNLIDRRCTPVSGTKQRNSFTITGRGGLPPSPNDTLRSESVMVDWVTLDPPSDNHSRNDTSAVPTALQTPTLTEAQGWVYGSNGKILLTAQAHNVTPHSPTLTPATCLNE